MAALDVVPDMQTRVIEYYNYLWSRAKGQQIKDLLVDAPYCLQSELWLAITFDMLEHVCITFDLRARAFCFLYARVRTYHI